MLSMGINSADKSQAGAIKRVLTSRYRLPTRFNSAFSVGNSADFAGNSAGEKIKPCFGNKKPAGG